MWYPSIYHKNQIGPELSQNTKILRIGTMQRCRDGSLSGVPDTKTWASALVEQAEELTVGRPPFERSVIRAPLT